MAWIILEGIDRSGKSTVASYYEKQGYEVFHMSAPDKKYSVPGYTGPSYIDDCLDIYMHFDGKNVVFDRSIYGEMVWPDVYGRETQLSYDDFEALRELEKSNNTQYILMSDPDFDAHWQRCVNNKEPLTRGQFNSAVAFYDKLATRFDFKRLSLADMKKELAITDEVVKPTNTPSADKVTVKADVIQDTNKSINQLKLEEANAINSILLGPILKKKGKVFSDIENSIRAFLQDRLASIFSASHSQKSFTEEEISILKLYVERLKQKMEKK